MKPPIESEQEIKDGPAAWFRLFANGIGFFGSAYLGFTGIQSLLDRLACLVNETCR